MKQFILSISFLLACYAGFSQSVQVQFITSKGNFTVMLYDQTPKHRDMFLEQVKKGTYNDALFNRVIKDFVSQAGELDDSILNREKRHPELGAKRFPAEFAPNAFHKKGALGAGRDDNPEKASYFNQIYLVAGKKHTDASLDAAEKRTGKTIPPARRIVYKTIGGTPHLDGDYTIFGEIVQGMDVADAINTVPTDKNDVPVTPVVFSVKVITRP